MYCFSSVTLNHSSQQEVVEKWSFSNVTNEGVHLYNFSGGQFGNRSQKLYKFNPWGQFRDVNTDLHKRLANKALSVTVKKWNQPKHPTTGNCLNEL